MRGMCWGGVGGGGGGGRGIERALGKGERALGKGGLRETTSAVLKVSEYSPFVGYVYFASLAVKIRGMYRHRNC